VQFHLKIRKRNGVLSAEYDYTASPNGHIPSIEKIFESAIDFKLKVLGIIMTGIGDDGTHALATLHSIYKRPTIAQSPIDSYAFGMPSALIQKGAADAVLQVNEIAEVINSVNTF
jgi:two-component system chemotaxis response regulator CheB